MHSLIAFAHRSKMVNCPIAMTPTRTARRTAAAGHERGRAPRAVERDADCRRAGVRPGSVGESRAPRSAARAAGRCWDRARAPRRPVARAIPPGRPAATLAGQPLSSPADRAMGRDRRRPAGAARPRLADVRPHPAQGSRAVHPLGRRDAHRSALARGACSRSCRSESTDSRSELTMIAQHLMELGDEATGKLGGITREFDSEQRAACRTMAKRSIALPKAARTDIAVLLDDLPRAEADGARRGRAAARSRQRIGARRPRSSSTRSASSPSGPQHADQIVAEATERLADAPGRDRNRGRSSRGARRRKRRPRSPARSTRCSTARRRRSRRSAPASTSQAAAVAALVAAGVGRHRQGGRGRGRNRWPRNIDHASSVARRPVDPRRRAGTRVAAHDRRDRARPRADRRALHRACRQRRRARQPFPRHR